MKSSRSSVRFAPGSPQLTTNLHAAWRGATRKSGSVPLLTSLPPTRLADCRAAISRKQIRSPGCEDTHVAAHGGVVSLPEPDEAAAGDTRFDEVRQIRAEVGASRSDAANR
jgi:hypothetical protein